MHQKIEYLEGFRYLKFLKSQTKNKKKNIYFYSENSNYKNYLIEILNKLNNSNKFKIF